MATDDSELKAEVRSLTEYDTAILTDSQLTSLLDIAKEEIRADIKLEGEETTLDFYSTKARERSLFWLTCLFARLRAGEYDSGEFSVAEVEVVSNNSNDQTLDLWLNQYKKRINQAKIPQKTFTANLSRSNRTYGE